MNYHALAVLLAAASLAESGPAYPAGRGDRFARDLEEAGRTPRPPKVAPGDLRRLEAAQAKRARKASKRKGGL